jgi:lipopolysaccharide export system permease protein
MKTFTRYILFELFVIFSLSLFAMTATIILFVIAQRALQFGLPPAQFLALLPYILPEALRMSIPGTLLLATTTVYGRMADSNEIVAIKGQGISPKKFLEPLWIAAFAISLVTVFLNDLAVSWGRQGIEQVIVESVEEIAYNMLRTQKSYKARDAFSINVKRVEGRTLCQPHIKIARRGNIPEISITAEEAELKTDRENGLLKIILRNGKLESDIGSYQFQDDEIEQIIPLRSASNASSGSQSPSQMAMRAIPQEIEKENRRIANLRQCAAAEAAAQLVLGRFDQLSQKEWWRSQSRLANSEKRLYRLQTEPHRRWSAGFSCLCFAWVGAPMAIRMRNRDLLTSFFLCFMPILIVYYPLLAMSINGAKDGSLPAISVWSGNILLLIWGAWLFRKVLRY